MNAELCHGPSGWMVEGGSPACAAASPTGASVQHYFEIIIVLSDHTWTFGGKTHAISEVIVYALH